MKTLQDIKEEHAKELGYESWWHYTVAIQGELIPINKAVEQVAERYANHVVDYITTEVKGFINHKP